MGTRLMHAVRFKMGDLSSVNLMQTGMSMKNCVSATQLQGVVVVQLSQMKIVKGTLNWQNKYTYTPVQKGDKQKDAEGMFVFVRKIWQQIVKNKG